jgi:hypothetical protein
MSLEIRLSITESRCPCGARVNPGTPCFRFEGVPEDLAGVMSRQDFCASSCVRSFLIDAMGVLEGAASPEFVQGVHTTYSHLRAMLALTSQYQGTLVFSPPPAQ